jgi:hypothetical protein
MPHFKLMTVPEKQGGKCMRCITTRLVALWRVVGTWLAAALIAGAALAQPGKPPVIALNDRATTVVAEQLGLFWMEPAGTATIDQVVLPAGAARFQPMQEGQIYSADEVGALWLHFRVDIDRSQWQGWLLEFPVPVLDLATVYLQDARGQWQAQSAGDLLASHATFTCAFATPPRSACRCALSARAGMTSASRSNTWRWAWPLVPCCC